jgi:hypothetical protein
MYFVADFPLGLTLAKLNCGLQAKQVQRYSGVCEAEEIRYSRPRASNTTDPQPYGAGTEQRLAIFGSRFAIQARMPLTEKSGLEARRE